MKNGDVATLFDLTDRNAGPALLFELWKREMLGVADLRELVVAVWEMAEFPERSLAREVWLAFFGITGFVSSPAGVSPPGHPLAIYRGATRRHRRGMAWASDLAVAGWFAGRFVDHASPTFLFAAEISPAHVLAIAEGRGETEVIVDPHGLENVRELDLDREAIMALAKERRRRVEEDEARARVEAREARSAADARGSRRRCGARAFDPPRPSTASRPGESPHAGTVNLGRCGTPERL